MVLKPKATKEELKELGEQTIKNLESQRGELGNQIAFFQAKVDDIERKIRWLRREILE